MKYLISFLIVWLANAGALAATAALVPGVRVKGVKGALLGSLALGFVSSVVAPVLTLLSLPLTVLSLGLWMGVLMGLMFWLAAAVAPDFEVDGCLSGFIGGLVLGLLNWILGLAFNFSGWW